MLTEVCSDIIDIPSRNVKSKNNCGTLIKGNRQQSNSKLKAKVDNYKNLRVVVGVRVVITENMCEVNRLVKGASDTIVEIIMYPVTSVVQTIRVKFDNPDCGLQHQANCKLLLHNIEGLNGHYMEMKNHSWLDKCDIVYLTETWLRTGKNAPEIDSHIYMLFFTVEVGNTSFGCTQNQLNFPTAIYIDSATNILYIVDTNNNRVQQLLLNSSSSEITTIAGDGINCTFGSTSEKLSNPMGIIVDQQQNLFISDSANNRIQLWLNKEKSGVTVAGNGSFGSELNEISSPQGLWTHQNTIFVVDRYNHRVTKWTLQPNATSQIVAGGNGQGNFNNQLNYPQGFYVDKTANDTLYISNTNGHFVTKWEMNAAQGSVYAGTPGKEGNSSLQLNYPTDVTRDQYGNLYVVDCLNYRIQMFCSPDSLEGITIAGTTGKGGNAANQLYIPES
ncbi:unnamed protein product, partial [Didymodactylos carnosus]